MKVKKQNNPKKQKQTKKNKTKLKNIRIMDKFLDLKTITRYIYCFFATYTLCK